MGKRSRKAPHFYCYGCLRKFHPNQDPEEPSFVCPKCGTTPRKCKNRARRNGTVTRLARLRGIIPPKPRTLYQDYLGQSKWKEIRHRVLCRDDHTCKHCGKRAYEVHHSSYHQSVMEGRNDTMLDSVCEKCHRKIHHIKKKELRAMGRERMKALLFVRRMATTHV